jgi:hypothetical protein
MEVSFIGGGNRSTDLPLTNVYHKILYRVHCAWAGLKLTLVFISYCLTGINKIPCIWEEDSILCIGCMDVY